MSHGITEKQVIDALRTVKDPELHRDLVSLEMIKDVVVNGTAVAFTVELTTPACPLKSVIQKDCEQALERIGVSGVEITFGARVRKAVNPNQSTMGTTIEMEGVKNIVLVASGKGGVGKSTVAANLAVALAAEGARVGLLDADLYGPSIPILFGVRERPTALDEKTVMPIRAHQIDLMSIGFFVAPEQAMIWRGPILSGTIMQFLRDVRWGELDYLIVDLPPGTGDVQLTIAQHLKVTGAVLVTTPQDVALADVTRGKAMFDQVKVPVLGIIENMSYFVCPGCGERHEIFAHGGGELAAERLSVPFLGAIPLETSIRHSGDIGVPVVEQAPTSPVALAFRDIARVLAGRISVVADEVGSSRGRLFGQVFRGKEG